jgi:DNA-directed RNA polymerase specialized sigma24 family protein
MALPQKQPALLPTADVLSDAELVARALQGDRWSRDMLYRRHAHYLLAISARLLSDRSEGEEVVQDTFVVGFEQLGTLREPAALRGWLARIAVSLVRRRLRRARLLRFLGLDRSPDDATLAALAAPELGPDDCAELALVDRVLHRMPANLRIAWMLRRVEGLPLAEVASVSATGPYDFDATEWVRAFKDAGFGQVMLTAKHAPGFCLWPSAYTDYSVDGSPWQDGQGDVVKEFTDAMHAADMKVGFYTPGIRSASLVVKRAAPAPKIRRQQPRSHRELRLHSLHIGRLGAATQ